MKRKTAKEILAESFRELAEKKTADKITVMEIAENCGYSTTTFYRHFHDKYDLMAWEYARDLERIVEKAGRAGTDWKHAWLQCAELFREQREYLGNLLQHTSGYEAFSQRMKNAHYEWLKKTITRAEGSDDIDVHLEMCARAFIYGAVDLSCEWILKRYDVTPEELTQVYIDSLPGLLRPYFLDK